MTHRKVKFVKIFADFSNAALPPDRKVASFATQLSGQNTVRIQSKIKSERFSNAISFFVRQIFLCSLFLRKQFSMIASMITSVNAFIIAFMITFIIE